MVYIILGIVFIICGTIITAYGIRKKIKYAIGVIIIAFGTFLTIYGPLIISSKENEGLAKNMEKFNEGLDNITNSNLSEELKEKKIKEIKNDFDEWAEQFVSNKEKIKLENQGIELEN